MGRGSLLIILVLVCFFGYISYETVQTGKRIATRMENQLQLIKQGN